MNENCIPYSFPITFLEQSGEKFSETLTKIRVRIFYKGRNRNGSYISDEFAEKLIKTLPYTPIKGIYDEDSEDYTDHGEERSEGRIYGIVPENFNFAWEKYLDEDGVEREYACADVLLYTALYKEANDIKGKSQSMELYKPSIKGQWINTNGQTTYKYSDGCFLGLQVLGDSVTPCFEGSSFFSLKDEQVFALFTKLFEKIDNLSKGGNNQMNINFALSDNQKQNAIFKALNTDTVRYFVLDTYDDYAIVYNLEQDKYEKVNYTKNEDDSISVADNFEEMFTEFVTASEKKALDSLRTKTEEQTFEAVANTYEENVKTISNIEIALNNKEQELSTLKQDKEKVDEKIVELNSQISQYEIDLNALKEFKAQVVKKDKEKVIEKYRGKLSDEIISNYTDKLDDFSLLNLEKELAYELVKENDSIFSLDGGQDPARVPKSGPLSGVEALINKHKTNS